MMDKQQRNYIGRSLRRLAVQIELDQVEVTDCQFNRGVDEMPPLREEAAAIHMGTGKDTMVISMVDVDVQARYHKELKRRAQLLAEIEDVPRTDSPSPPSPNLSPGREIKDGGPPRKDRNDG